MQIKLRVRVNDILDSDKGSGEFIYFDNCAEVLTQKRQEFDYDWEGQPENAYRLVSPERSNNHVFNSMINPTTHKKFDQLHVMLRHRGVTARRLTKEIQALGQDKIAELSSCGKPISSVFDKTPYHLNMIDWKDRVTGQWHRLIFDTVVFLLNDQGGTLQKIDG